MSYTRETLRWATEQADIQFATKRYEPALDQIARVVAVNSARPVDSSMPDSFLRMLAQRRADLMVERIAASGEVITMEWIGAQLQELGASLPEIKPYTEAALQGITKRVMDAFWWRRQLRRSVVRMRETEAMQAGEVCARKRQPYVTRDTVKRRQLQQDSNQAMLETTELESAGGDILTLWDAVQASVSNKAIRRGELMTRIRGAEEWADEQGMAGLFTTNTLPSRFHAQTMRKGANPKHDGSTPKQGQAWLCKTWARTRAAIKRQGLRVFGFRVAEPHHDACPHWHMLLWCDPAHIDALRTTMREQWLRPESSWRCMVHGRKWLFTELGELEPGAAQHRVKFKDLEKGGAAGYVAKYISKGIDDAGAVSTEGHKDEVDGEQADMFGGNAKLVEAWAAAWGIRQFQAIGQPPVTVWRELRRVSDQAAEGASSTVQAARRAVNRDGERRACWNAYLMAQGGAMTGRAYAVRMALDLDQREGRYGLADAVRPMGVFDAARPDEWILSDRKEWKPRGAWADFERTEIRGWRFEARPKAAQPWTRVINCTRPAAKGYLMGAGIVGAMMQKRPGGALHQGLNHENPPSHRGASPNPH